MLGIGNDIIEIDRITGAIARQGQKFVNRVFTQTEQEYCQRFQEPGRHFAGRFAAKEAIFKALGTGLAEGLDWHDVEIVNDKRGKPVVRVSEKLEERFGAIEVLISISHCKSYATAMAVVI